MTASRDLGSAEHAHELGSCALSRSRGLQRAARTGRPVLLASKDKSPEKGFSKNFPVGGETTIDSALAGGESVHVPSREPTAVSQRTLPANGRSLRELLDAEPEACANLVDFFRILSEWSVADAETERETEA